jgi:Cu+-exporting ATPase
MHYTPPEFWNRSRGDTPASRGGPASGLHPSTAAIYALTTVCVGLLTTDIAASWCGIEPFSAWGLPLKPALLAALFGGVRFLYRSLDGLLSGQWGADLALALATLAALAIGDPLTAASVVCIALVGEAIEAGVWSAAQSTLNRLYAVAPSPAHRLRDNRETDVPVDEIQVDDLIAIRPGESIPCDGVIVEGEGRADESLITGESKPIAKQLHDRVLAGSLLAAGWLTVRVDRAGADSTLQRLSELVRQAASRRSPCERRADRFAKWFLPFVLAAAAIAAVGWRWKTGDWSASWTPVLTVLVIACPCPLILATPTAALAAVMRLARRGVVIRGTDALQRLTECQSFAFDKTGTLTTGAMSVVHIESLGEVHPHDILRLAASAESASEHPIGRAIVAAATERGVVVPRPNGVEILTGKGLRADVAAVIPRLPYGPEPDFQTSGHRIVVGSRRWISPGDAADTVATGLKTSVLVGVETQPGGNGERTAANEVHVHVFGRIELSDEIDAAAAPVLQRLKSRGLSLAILSGDSESAVRSVSERIGSIDEVHASLLPDQKVAWIEQKQQAGRKVAAMGDGVNDAPALAAAHVGLAVVTPTNAVTAAAGDLLLMSRPIAVLPEVCFVAREFVATVDRGIVWFGLVANGIGVAAAMLGLLPPIVGAVLHEVTAAAVMLLALRLLWVRDPLAEAASPTPVSSRGVSAAEPMEPPASVFDWFAPEAWLAEAWRERIRLGQGAVLLGLLAWLGSNIHCLDPEEQGIVLRFGRVQSELKGGWHWRWPYPFETVQRELTQRVQRITLGFRPSDQPPRESRRVIEWTTDHRLTNEQPVPDESAWLVHDELAVEGTAELHFRIVNLRSFAFGHHSPREWIAAAFQSTLVELASTAPLGDLLTVDRRRWEADCQRAVQQAADHAGLGVEIVGVHLLDVHPPVSVVPEYHDVGDAIEYKDEQKSLGESAAIRRLSAAVGGRFAERLAPELFDDAARDNALRDEATRDNAAGDNAAGDDVRPLTEDWAAWSRSITALEPGEPIWLAGYAAATLLNADAEHRRIESDSQSTAARIGALVPAMRASRRAARLELFWGTLEPVLAGRPLTIVDSQVADRWRWWRGNAAPAKSEASRTTSRSSRDDALQTEARTPSPTQADSESPSGHVTEDHEP